MSESDWRPLSWQTVGRPKRVLLEGVPDHLESPLRRWVLRTLDPRMCDGLAQRVALRLHLDPRDLRAVAEPALSPTDALVWGTTPEQLLDVVDAVLFLHPSHRLLEQSGQGAEHAPEQSLLAVVYASTRNAAATPLQVAADSLRDLLADASSVWTVAEDARGLRRRIDSTATAAFSAAALAATTSEHHQAADDLAQAWAKTYGLHPDPSEAYRLAIRAVEHAAVPVVLPQNRAATLTQVRNHLKDAQAKWQLATGGDVATLTSMLTLLAAGQTDRHGGQASQPPTPAAVEMAVHLATTLVQWFTAGHVQRVP